MKLNFHRTKGICVVINNNPKKLISYSGKTINEEKFSPAKTNPLNNSTQPNETMLSKFLNRLKHDTLRDTVETKQ